MKFKIAHFLLLTCMPAVAQAQAYPEESLSPYKVQEIKLEQLRTVPPRVQELKVEQPRIGSPKMEQTRVERPVLLWPKVEGSPVDDRLERIPSGDPIAVSDFKNGIYTLNGQQVAFEDLWDDRDIGVASVVPGVGLRFSEDFGAFHDIQGLLAKKALTAAVAGGGGGYTYVMDALVDTPDVWGSGSVIAYIYNEDASGDHFAAPGLDFDPPTVGDWGCYVGVTAGDVTYPVTPNEMHRIAFNIDAVEAFSADGGAVEASSNREFMAPITTVRLQLRHEGIAEPGFGGPMKVIIERVAFYPLQRPDRLTILSQGRRSIPSTSVGQSERPRDRSGSSRDKHLAKRIRRGKSM